jgi:hypothetical protein
VSGGPLGMGADAVLPPYYGDILIPFLLKSGSKSLPPLRLASRPYTILALLLSGFLQQRDAVGGRSGAVEKAYDALSRHPLRSARKP